GGETMRLFPRKLAGQLLLLLLGGVFCAHLLGIILFYLDSPNPIQLAQRNQITSRAASAVRVLEGAPKESIPPLLEAINVPAEKFWIDWASGAERATMNEQEAQLARELERKIGGADHHVTIKFGKQTQDPPTGLLAFTVAARLRDGSWFHFEQSGIAPLKWWRDLPFSIAVSTIPVLLVVALFVGWITRPVRALAQAAEQVGRGERTDPLPVTGPSEIQERTAAFNAMQERLLRFVRDRTRMLAAISHDFRTPITSLRLRAEMVEDEGIRSAMTRTLDEMRDMVEATLSFASESA